MNSISLTNPSDTVRFESNAERIRIEFDACIQKTEEIKEYNEYTQEFYELEMVDQCIKNKKIFDDLNKEVPDKGRKEGEKHWDVVQYKFKCLNRFQR
jgi:hypothetical protein